MDKDIKVKCKRCGRSSKAEEFVLDSDFRMMVCQNCIKEKKMKNEVYDELSKKKELKKGKIEEVEKKPAGWDKEDEYLERTQKMRMKEMAQVERVDDEKVKYKCPKCSYKFLYNSIKKIPGRCPYCNSDIARFRL